MALYCVTVSAPPVSRRLQGVRCCLLFTERLHYYNSSSSLAFVVKSENTLESLKDQQVGDSRGRSCDMLFSSIGAGRDKVDNMVFKVQVQAK